MVRIYTGQLRQIFLSAPILMIFVQKVRTPSLRFRRICHSSQLDFFMFETYTVLSFEFSDPRCKHRLKVEKK